MFRILTLTCALALLSGCAGTTAKNDIAASQATLTGLEAAAFQYVKLPVCGTPGATVCKSLAIEAKIGQADNAAYIAVKAAEAAAANPNSGGTAIQQAQTAATAALGAFQAIVLSLPTGAKP